MKGFEPKMVLSLSDRQKVEKALGPAGDELLRAKTRRANVVGLGAGVKWSGGAPTGEPAVVVLVSQKLDKGSVASKDMVPEKLADMQTDVLAVGFPVAQSTNPSLPAAERGRAKGGASVGHVDITAGTIGTCVYDIQPDGAVSPPEHGIGMPAKYYILSNNHVLANSNAARIGDPILQPGPYDGGTDPRDRVATLSRFVPITMSSNAPLEEHENLVDAAIAEGDFFLLDREIHWIGPVRGWRRREDVEVGTIVQKTGRTTGYTTGRITAVAATIDVNYGGGKVARFKDQIVTTAMSEGGDSGSLVTTTDNVAVGLLFAGSPMATIVNQIEHVRSLLRVEVAEVVL
jgi:hypothetical protein